MNIFKTIHIFTGRLDTYMVSIIMLQTIIKQMFYEAKKKDYVNIVILRQAHLRS